MQFRILGPLEVEGDGEPLALGGAKQRAVLAVLLLHANRVVSRDRLIDAVWGERAPETAYSALQGYVSALRKALGADLILTRAPGYVLETAPTSVDLGRFEALDLWRGEPLADLDSLGFVQIERVRLGELRLSAVEERVDADLALGRHPELVAELHALVGEHPLRERLRAQLMLTLYRSGRQAEALDVYQQGRRLLAEELGLEPGEALKRLEHAILEHDPAHGAPARAARTSPPARKRRSRRPLAVALAIIGLGGLAGGLAVALTGRSEKALPVRADSLAVIDTHTNRLVGDVPIDGRPVAIAADDTGVYAAAREGIVWRIDPATRRVVGRIGVSGDVHDLALGFGSVWLADGTDGTVTRIDNRLGGLTTIPLRPENGNAPAFWIATDASGVWVTRGDLVEEIDPALNRVVKVFSIPRPAGLTTGFGSLWLATTEGLVRGPRLAGRASSSYPLPGFVSAPTLGEGSAWAIVYHGTGEVWRFGRRLTATGPAGLVGGVGRYPLDLTVGDGSVWTVDTQGLVSRIDPTALRVRGTIRTTPTIRSSLAVADGDLWVAIQRPR